jgi:integrase
LTGKQKTKSAGSPDEKEAERAAAVWEDELRSGRYQAASKVTWAEFRQRYEAERLLALAPSTRHTANDSFDHLERIINPGRLSSVTAAVLSKFAAELRKPRVVTKGDRKVTKPPAKENTIARHLRHIKAGLRWAESIGLLGKAPKVEMPHRAKGQTLARSRAVTTEEYERMLAAVPRVRPQDARAWQRFIEGLWLSGLRLSEGLVLSWDEGSPFAVDLTGRRPAFRIYREGQKSGRDEVLPMTPDFAEFLLTTPEPERAGPVFRLLALHTGKPIKPGRVGVMVGKIGRKAGVVTNKADGKFAGCHDLRRAFGNRWASRVKPAVLQRLMRHSSIGTTMAYYVALDSADVADELWGKWGPEAGNSPAPGNKSGNMGPDSTKNAAPSEPHKSLLSNGLD